MSLFDFLNPVQDLAKIANDIIGKFVADPKEKAAAQLSLYQAQVDAQSKVLDFQKDMAEQQAKVVTAEAQSQSWLARNWRPILMLVFTGIIAWDYIVVPIFRMPPATVPDQMWTLLNIGIGGYIGGRTIEKVGPAIVGAIKGNGK